MKRINILLIYVVVIFILVSWKGKTSIDDGNAHKKYKDENGNFVKNDWVEIEGNWYYFDENGYLVVDQWVEDEYYVDENGVMQVNH